MAPRLSTWTDRVCKSRQQNEVAEMVRPPRISLWTRLAENTALTHRNRSCSSICVTAHPISDVHNYVYGLKCHIMQGQSPPPPYTTHLSTAISIVTVQFWLEQMQEQHQTDDYETDKHIVVRRGGNIDFEVCTQYAVLF